MVAERVSRSSRRFVLTGAALFVAWRAADLLGAGRSTAVALGLYGFLFLTLFGKAYALVPAYFDRTLALPDAPRVQWPLSVTGTVLLAAGYPAVGAAAWTAGVAVFLAALLWTVRDNPLGRETGTGEANADRRRVDRAANAAVPVALAYLAAGSYDLLAAAAGLPTLVAAPARTHLLAAGTVALLVFAVGFRLLPRFLVGHPPRALVAVVLPAGALGPALIAAGFGGGPLFHAGAALEAAAVIGFAAAVVLLVVRSDRRRVARYALLAAAASGTAGVALGLWFAVSGPTGGLIAAHYRLNLLGFLGLTVVGAAYQFYPPGVGTHRGVDDRTALGSIVALAAGLLVAAVGSVVSPPLVVVGDAVTLAGAVAYAGLLAALFVERHGRQAV
ncbi:hypothetical protein [Halorarius halobius]|uniref:hypothetical protein n=1 Tax=Halorarius halobius TaxID=2962671 RepID=UPI0020CC0E2B|nr:hypothetical protein [Halorarius halobius]